VPVVSVDYPIDMIAVPHICRETSNKALNAINDIHLVPFLMSFLDAHEKLALAPVTAAGRSVLYNLSPLSVDNLLAQCLYVLTDDNLSAIEEVRADARYIACLSSIARKEPNGTGSETKADPRSITLSILAAGRVNFFDCKSLSYTVSQEPCATFLRSLHHRLHPSLILTKTLSCPFCILSSRPYRFQRQRATCKS